MATRVGLVPIGVDEVQAALATHGGRYLDRVFTDEERRSIGVRRAVSGRPVLELTGAAAGLARRHGIAELSVRLIHEVSSAARWYWRRRGTMTDSVNTQIRRVLSVRARLPLDVDSLTDQTDHS